MPLIESFGLTKRFGEILAVDNLNLQVEQGEVLGFLGPNGAGKTTTIRMLAGIIAQSDGYAIVAGIRPEKKPEQLHEYIGLLTESPGLYERLSAKRNLEYFAGFYQNIDIHVQVEKYLKLVGLWNRRNDNAGKFSKGMKHRLALARTLIHEPKILFLDEPTAGLDPEAAREVRDLIKKFSTEGRTIFLSTHNLGEADLLCHRIAVIKTKLLIVDTPNNLRKKIFQSRVIITLEAITQPVIKVIKALVYIDNFEQLNNKLIINFKDPEKNRPELLESIIKAGGRVLEVTQEQHSLEDVYLTLIKEDKHEL